MDTPIKYVYFQQSPVLNWLNFSVQHLSGATISLPRTLEDLFRGCRGQYCMPVVIHMHECSVCYSVKEDRTQKQHLPCGLSCTECGQLWSWCAYYILQIASDSLFMSRVHSWHSDSSCDNYSLKKTICKYIISDELCTVRHPPFSLTMLMILQTCCQISSMVQISWMRKLFILSISHTFPSCHVWFYACFMDLHEGKHPSHSVEHMGTLLSWNKGEKYEPHPLPLYCFLEDHSIAADSCPGINGRTDIAEQTSHLKSLGPECFRRMSSYRKSSFFIFDPCDYSSSRGYTCEHWFSYKTVQVNTYPVEQLRAAADTENDRVAAHHSFLADGNYVRIGPSPWKSCISCGSIRGFSEWEAAWHKWVVLPDLLTPAGIPGSLVQFISHNTSRSDSAHWK